MTPPATVGTRPPPTRTCPTPTGRPARPGTAPATAAPAARPPRSARGSVPGGRGGSGMGGGVIPVSQQRPYRGHERQRLIHHEVVVGLGDGHHRRVAVHHVVHVPGRVRR